MKITYEKLFEVIDVLNMIRLNDQYGKFNYVVSKNTPALQKLIKKYNESLFDISLEYAQVDEKTGSILKDDKGEFIFTKEASQNKEIKLRELKLQEVEFDVYMLQDLTEHLYRLIGVAACDIFSGVFLISKQVDEANNNEAWNSPKVEEVAKVEVTK